jgi:hypothetical protein
VNARFRQRLGIGVALCLVAASSEALESTQGKKLQLLANDGGSIKLTGSSLVPAVSILVDRRAILAAHIAGPEVAVEIGTNPTTQNPSQLVATLLLPAQVESSVPAVGQLYTSVQRTDGTGKISFDVAYCTATLVAPRVVLTAAHCVDYKSALGRSGDAFQVTTSVHNLTRNFVYDVDLYKSLGGTVGPNDLALVKLKSDVPPEVAQPAELRKDPITPAAKVRIFGFGCTDRTAPDVGLYTKRSVEVPWPIDATLPILCPGDSGGPVAVTADQKIQVVAVNSAFWTSNALVAAKADVFADVIANWDALRKSIADIVGLPSSSLAQP